MVNSESVEAFYERMSFPTPQARSMQVSGMGHFNVFERNACSVTTPYSRRDFYKISFVIGTGTLHYADKWIRIDQPALFFSNPLIPYAWEPESEMQTGWFCLFTEAFIQPNDRIGALQESPLFRVGGNPVFFMDSQQHQDIAAIYQKMLQEMHSDYSHKYEVLRHQLHLLIHEAMKMEPGENFKKPKNASSRICTLFFELLERQFPIDNPGMQLKLKTAADFARSLSIHVNHLNRAVKTITGKPTTEHIAARLLLEGKALLQHTDWTIAEIAYSLGFEYPSYFSIFFKKLSGGAPNDFRKPIV
ncbi:AraC family transcriptional activator of pobA [Mucilaginibacter sp. HD30]